jgi:hypothetical protein
MYHTWYTVGVYHIWYTVSVYHIWYTTTMSHVQYTASVYIWYTDDLPVDVEGLVHSAAHEVCVEVVTEVFEHIN